MLQLNLFFALLASVTATTTISGLFKSFQKGNGTYYDYNTYGTGSCMIGLDLPEFVESKNLWRVAIANPQYSGDGDSSHSYTCGMCIKVYNYTKSPVIVYVNNLCPGSCGSGSMDVATMGGKGGRTTIYWNAVPCPVGSEKVKYKIRSTSNSWWMQLMPIAHSIPVTTIQIKVAGSWVSMKPTSYGYWTWQCSSAGEKVSNYFPLAIRLTGYNGDVLEDYIPTWNPGSVQVGSTKVQFDDTTTITTSLTPPYGPTFALPEAVSEGQAVSESGTQSGLGVEWLAMAMGLVVVVLVVVIVVLVVVVVVLIGRKTMERA